MWINGNEDDSGLAADEGFFFGYGVFETILVLEAPVMLEYHWERLNQGLKMLGIDRHITLEMLRARIQALACKNEAFKINVTPKNIVCSKRPLLYTPQQYELGYKLGLSSIRKCPESHALKVKSMNYMDNLIESRRARANGLDDVLFLNNAGMLTETCFSNLFLIKGDRLRTPAVSCGLLEGTMRRWIMEHFPVETGELTLQDLREAQGAFLTNSLMGIMKVAWFEERALPDHRLRQEVAEGLKAWLAKEDMRS